MTDLTDLTEAVWELEMLVGHAKGERVHPLRVATAAAEEVGEAIGAMNKLLDGRGNPDDFLAEWAQAMLMLTWLGTRVTNWMDGEDPRAELGRAIDAEMMAQRAKWEAAART